MGRMRKKMVNNKEEGKEQRRVDEKEVEVEGEDHIE
jgi:hypothetical protein